MKKHHLFASTLTTAVLASSPALAEFCDWRPSQWFGNGAAAAIGSTTASTAAFGATATALGYYTLTNATTGATMLASTAAGSSAAGTVGIIGGTSTGIGATVGGAMSAAPVAAAATIVLVGVEGGCYFLHDEVVSDPQAVFDIIHSMAVNADPDVFRLDYPDREGPIAPSEIQLVLRNSEGRLEIYDFDDLYIWNGILKYDGWVNGEIGVVNFVIPD